MLFVLVFKIINTPGPGTYKPVDGINSDGIYATSEHQRTRTPNMKKNVTERATKYDRIPKADKHKPGPGWYDQGHKSLSINVFKKALPMTKSR